MFHGHGTTAEAREGVVTELRVRCSPGGPHPRHRLHPLSPVVGGALAGDLRADDARAGAQAGGLAGLGTVIPLAALASSLLTVPLGPVAPVALPDPIGLALGLGSVLFAGYVLLCSVPGGVRGSFVASEIDITGR